MIQVYVKHRSKLLLVWLPLHFVMGMWHLVYTHFFRNAAGAYSKAWAL